MTWKNLDDIDKKLWEVFLELNSDEKKIVLFSDYIEFLHFIFIKNQPKSFGNGNLRQSKIR